MIRGQGESLLSLFRGLVVPTYGVEGRRQVVGGDPLPWIGLTIDLISIDLFAELAGHGREIVTGDIEPFLLTDPVA